MGRQKARKPRRPRPTDRPDLWAVFDVEDQLVLAQSIRRSCDQCRSTHLHWGDVAGGVWSARSDKQRAAFTEAVAEGLSTSAPAWWCMDCEGLGIFAGLERA